MSPTFLAATTLMIFASLFLNSFDYILNLDVIYLARMIFASILTSIQIITLNCTILLLVGTTEVIMTLFRRYRWDLVPEHYRISSPSSIKYIFTH